MTVQIELLDPEAAADDALVDDLTRVINDAYCVGEDGLWVEGTVRVTPTDVADAIRTQEMIKAADGDRLVGCACLVKLDDGTLDLGMLSVALDAQGAGIGRALREFAEDRARQRGAETVQLDLLVPLDGTHPAKEDLRAWYLRSGYAIVGSQDPEDVVPDAARLAVPCRVLNFRKSLA
jgi:GNAT superfamily N-acetyltransferase